MNFNGTERSVDSVSIRGPLSHVFLELGKSENLKTNSISALRVRTPAHPVSVLSELVVALEDLLSVWVESVEHVKVRSAHQISPGHLGPSEEARVRLEKRSY